MRRGDVALVGLLVAAQQSPFAPGPFTSSQDAGYVEPAVCAGCHRSIYESYRQTGMGRSFYRPQPKVAVEDYRKNNTYHHQASDRLHNV